MLSHPYYVGSSNVNDYDDVDVDVDEYTNATDYDDNRNVVDVDVDDDDEDDNDDEDTSDDDEDASVERVPNVDNDDCSVSSFGTTRKRTLRRQMSMSRSPTTSLSLSPTQFGLSSQQHYNAMKDYNRLRLRRHKVCYSFEQTNKECLKKCIK